jgi:integrase/recombinase XerD
MDAVRGVIYGAVSMSASQGSCRVQRVVERGRGSWTVIGTDRRPVQAADRYLAWLTSIEKSPNTVRAYACDLKLFFVFLGARALAWDRVSLEALGEFTAWLRSPAENVIVLEHGTPARTASSVNRTLSAVFGFYEFHARDGVPVARELVARGRSGSGSYKPFLHGIASSRPRGRVGRVGEVQRLPRSLTVEQVQAILEAQRRLRDRFLFALLFETGMRVGQALGLRHEDVVSWERRIEIRPRGDNANGARGKGGRGSVPVSGELIRLHLDYMHEEYGDLDCDYVFANLWGGRRGAPLRYDSVYELAKRTSARVGFEFTPHTLRHTHATLARRGGMSLDALQRMLTHRSQSSTAIYAHTDVEDLRDELERAGMLGIGRRA